MIPLRALPHRLTFRPYAGDGSEGKSYGQEVADVPARVELGVKVILDASGKEVVAEALISFQPTNAPHVGDEVTLPDGRTRPVLVRKDHTGRRAVGLVTVHV